MHQQVREFCQYVKRLHPGFFADRTVLDCGSLDVNGNNRGLFDRCAYVGVDVGPGPNVDFVSTIHTLGDEWKGQDVVISTEAFEHDKHCRDSIARMIELLAPGGLMVFTCATTGRAEHGTERSKNKWCAPLLSWEHYENVTWEMIHDLFAADFPRYEVNVLNTDLRFWGIKRPGDALR